LFQSTKINLGISHFCNNLKSMNSALRSIIAGLIIIVLVQQQGCASRGRPGGGPIDKIPPEIVYTFPQPDSLNVSQLDKIEIYFSERMDEASVTNSIFISPPIEYEIEWSGGEELSLDITSDLQEKRTYLITIGTGAMDARKNKMKESFQLAFSTGAYLDQGQLSGQIYGISAKDNFYIYAYQMDHPDSLNPTINRADFLSQPSEDGQFNMQYLPLAEYRVFVVEDQNKNLLLDANYERVGIPFRDLSLDSLKMQESDLNFRVTQIDTVEPMLTGARAIYNDKVLLRFSEPIQSPANIQIMDTLNFQILDIKSLVSNSENLSQLYAFTEQLRPDRGYRVQASGLKDLKGNQSTLVQIADFVGSDKADTTHFELLSVIPTDSSKNVKYPANIEIKFSIPIDTLSLHRAFVCKSQNGDTINGNWYFQDLTVCTFKPDLTFLPDHQYSFELNLGKVNSLFDKNLVDSLIQNTFFMIPSDEFGSLSGSTNLDQGLVNDAIIEIIPIGGNSESTVIGVRENNTFFAEWLTAGKYKIGGFIDFDKNNTYSFGGLYPFVYSEPVFVNLDTIKIRKRWEFGGIQVNFPIISEEKVGVP
jgi:hypothetical protein